MQVKLGLQFSKVIEVILKWQGPQSIFQKNTENLEWLEVKIPPGYNLWEKGKQKIYMEDWRKRFFSKAVSKNMNNFIDLDIPF